MHSLVHVCTILKNFGQRPFMEGLHVYMYMYMLCVSQNGCENSQLFGTHHCPYILFYV